MASFIANCFMVRDPPGSHMAFDYHISPVSFNPEPFLSFSVPFITLTLLEFRPVILQNGPQYGCVCLFPLAGFMSCVFVRNLPGVALGPSHCIILGDTWCQFVPAMVILTLVPPSVSSGKPSSQYQRGVKTGLLSQESQAPHFRVFTNA